MNNIYQQGFTDHTFLSAAETTAAGTAFVVGGYRDLVVEVTGTTATATRTISFYGTAASGTKRAITGIMYSASDTAATSTSGINELWGFDITGLHEVYVDLTAVSGDTVTATGRAVS